MEAGWGRIRGPQAALAGNGEGRRAPWRERRLPLYLDLEEDTAFARKTETAGIR